ncbi:MAG: DNA polymerase ligase N-terminal domain-containing protein [Rhodospirillales bacterium]
MALEEYRKKRKFGETPEPAGTVKQRAEQARFVVQKHLASHLHYDFRLEIDGVLVSWAVPKGPSLNPRDKRLAMMTEDHPLEYADFEGVIPEGNYGAGKVMVWDRGAYEVQGKPAAEQLAEGALKFTLKGEKLRGGFALVNTGRRAADPRQKKRWLLIKERDEFADPSWNIDEQDWSVLTHRGIKEIE